MDSFALNISELRELYTESDLRSLIARHSTKIKIIVPLPSIGVTNWPMNIAADYLYALFVGETIAAFCSSISGSYEDKTIHFVIKPKDIDALTQSVLWLSSVFNEEGEEPEQVHSYIAEFAENLEQKDVRFPEIGDSYLANFVNGIEGFDEEEYIEEMYQQHPEWKYRFWRSFTSKKLKYDVYASAFAWIIPHSLKGEKSAKIVEQVLTRYAGFKKNLPPFQEAQWLSIGCLPAITFNEYAMTSYPHRGISAAQKCAAEIWRRKFQQAWSRRNSREEEIQKAAWSMHNDPPSLKLSEDGVILIATDVMAHYLFFRESMTLTEMAEQYTFWTEDSLIDTYVKAEGERLWALPQKIHNQYLEALDKVTEGLNSLRGNPVSIKLPWNKVNDDIFEELCYDIIGESEFFDPDTRRRMGKSRSRDGGRDIEVYSRRRIGVIPDKWIVQCKFTKVGRSLAGSKVQVSDVIDQYGANGFCIMTNGPIDSTLHDKLGGIAYNRKIESDEWDGMRIERVLARPRYRNIRKRYFGI